MIIIIGPTRTSWIDCLLAAMMGGVYAIESANNQRAEMERQAARQSRQLEKLEKAV